MKPSETPQTSTDKLAQRIKENKSAQSLNFNEWIFSQFQIDSGSCVLELCCGTGSQSVVINDLIGPRGDLVLLDASRKAVDTVKEKIGTDKRIYLCRGLDDLLVDDTLEEKQFDLIFCSYGLYYAQDVEGLLKNLKGLLGPQGKIVIVGPYGPNNGELFDLLKDNGVELDEKVAFSSGPFMTEVVRPFSRNHFEQTLEHVTQNVQKWSSVEHLMQYWQNTTFYDAGRAEAVRAALEKEFERDNQFLVTKHIMFLEMSQKKEER